MKLGLYSDTNGILYLDGTKFYGMGLNFFDGYSRTSCPNIEGYEDSLKKISENNIPFIRLMFGEYYAINIRKYLDDPKDYFKRMDDFVQAAEKYKIGIIASLFWWLPGVPDLMGESVSSIGNPNSKTVSFAKKYTHDIVTRYKDSPALWGWEIGNEYNLDADIFKMLEGITHLPTGAQFGSPEKRTLEDWVTTENIKSFYTEISTEIRKHDPNRIIINGDADYRNFQFNIYKNDTMAQDTQDELKAAIKIFSPAEINVLSIHIYELEQERFGKKATFEELLEIYKNYSTDMKKVLYLGEFGAKTEELMKRQFDAIKKLDIQLSSPWNYNMINLTHDSFSDTGNGSFMFWGTVEINREYKERKLQITENYWDGAFAAQQN